jgi:hypothetical protein
LSTEQRENLEAALRRSPVPVGSSVSEQRRLLGERPTMDTKSDVDPLLSQAGTPEVLLEDAVRLAQQAAADVAVTLDLTQGPTHPRDRIVTCPIIERRNTCERQ